MHHRGHRRRRLAVLLGAVVAVGALAVGGATTSLALFTDSQSVSGNAFSTGTISLGLSPATALLTSGALMPGDTVNGSLLVSNAGTAQLRYAMSSSSTNTDGKGLAAQMTLVVKTLGTSCAAFDGTTVYTGALSAAAFGSNAAGSQAGDRTLNGASSETLCFRASLPLASGNAYQGAGTTATFTFDAEQTANNP
jgi:predicted ribosomally synthesized peptide with SipW-like signal peptide